jgi:hypothetical protein
VTITAPPALHMPDEPTGHAGRWLADVLDGRPLEEVLGGDAGVSAWLWSRWRSLQSAGVGEHDLREMVLDYRRELWLWLAGERTWNQCCSGLIGRVSRRPGARGGAGP